MAMVERRSERYQKQLDRVLKAERRMERAEWLDVPIDQVRHLRRVVQQEVERLREIERADKNTQ